MIGAVLDTPSLGFVLPASTTSQDLREFVRRLVDWNEYLRCASPLLEVLTSRRALSLLAELNLFPGERRVHQLLSAHGLMNVLSPKDVSAQVTNLLTRAGDVEETSEVQCLLQADVSLEPALYEGPEFDGLREDAIDCVCLIAAHNSRNGAPTLALALPTRQPGVDEIQLQCVVEAAEPADATLPARIQQNVSLLRNPAQVGLLVDPARLWEAAKDERCLALALRAGATARAGVQQGVTGVREFGIGTSFVASLQRNQAFGMARHAMTTFSKCVDVLSGTNVHRVKELRDGPGGAVVTRPHDGSVARRLHITRSGVGLRLHFWDRPDGRVEFANIGPKNELIIR